MRIYVACLASYNNGVLHGRWIDASTDTADMWPEINAMLRESRFPNVMRVIFTCEPCGETETVTYSMGESPTPRPCEHCSMPMAMGDPFPSAEEWAIHDHEGLGDLGEYAGLNEVAKRVSVATLADERDIPLSVLLDFANDRMTGDWDADDLESEFNDSYRGAHESWADFAEEYTRETNDMSAVPEWLESHIDWKSLGRDFEMGGDFTAYRDGEHGDLYFFWAH